jgi:hypothetical protein
MAPEAAEAAEDAALETDTTESQEQASVFGMSDEDFTSLDTTFLDDAPEEISDVVGEETNIEEEQSLGEEENLAPETVLNDEDSTAEEDLNPQDNDDNNETLDETVDYQNFHAAITTPFKANGKQIKVDNPEDAIRLMQMGADYNRKMASLKPARGLLKTLEKNGIDTDRLDFLIDLDKKNPAAIAKLVKEAGLDPLEIDLDQEKEYKAPLNDVSDSELALDNVIEDIRATDTFNRTIGIVGDSWDAESKQIIADAPQLLTAINDQVASGVYDLISTEVDRQQTLGQLTGLSNIAAYKQVGDMLQANNAFDHLFPEQRQQNVKASATPPKSKVDGEQLKNKRRAASATKPVASTGLADYNPLGMSDEEFLKNADNMNL